MTTAEFESRASACGYDGPWEYDEPECVVWGGVIISRMGFVELAEAGVAMGAHSIDALNNAIVHCDGDVADAGTQAVLDDME